MHLAAFIKYTLCSQNTLETVFYHFSHTHSKYFIKACVNKSLLKYIFLLEKGKETC